MKQHVSTYTGGLNRDTAYDSLPPQFYIDAMDMHITTTFGESNNAVINIKGNKKIHTLANTGETVIGATTLRDDIIVATTTDSSEEGGQGYFYKLEYDKETDTSVLTLLYDSADLGFTILHPLELHAIYETEDTH